MQHAGGKPHDRGGMGVTVSPFAQLGPDIVPVHIVPLLKPADLLRFGQALPELTAWCESRRPWVYQRYWQGPAMFGGAERHLKAIPETLFADMTFTYLADDAEEEEEEEEEEDDRQWAERRRVCIQRLPWDEWLFFCATTKAYLDHIRGSAMCLAVRGGFDLFDAYITGDVFFSQGSKHSGQERVGTMKRHAFQVPLTPQLKARLSQDNTPPIAHDRCGGLDVLTQSVLQVAYTFGHSSVYARTQDDPNPVPLSWVESHTHDGNIHLRLWTLCVLMWHVDRPLGQTLVKHVNATSLRQMAGHLPI